MTTGKVLSYPAGMYRVFERKGGPAPTATHYCPGCGHGILHKLIGEAMADLQIQDRTVFISPVGCAVFGYHYLDCGNIQAAHGRAAAVGAGLTRVADDAIVISYQGDGDLCSIGLNETLQAANRGDRLAVLFVNNAVYGMTGGQMAPTSLDGQKTTTSPMGRDVHDTGPPLHMCELLGNLETPVYIERCSLADTKRIRKARRAVRKALQIQKDRKGFAFVELLSPCPVNMRCDPIEAARFVAGELEAEFPLGCFRDRSSAALQYPCRTPLFDFGSVDAVFRQPGVADAEPVPDPAYQRRRTRVSGFGGQGVLSLGLMLARAGMVSGRYVTWMPSYGPEQRGGTANCAVVIDGSKVGSPTFRSADVLLALNRPSLQRFGPSVTAAGIVLYDATDGEYSCPSGATCVAVPAREIAADAGAPKAANTALLGALAAAGTTALPRQCFERALSETFCSKPELLPVNRAVFGAAYAWYDALTQRAP